MVPARVAATASARAEIARTGGVVSWAARRAEASVAVPTDHDITRPSHERPAGFEECVDLRAFALRADGAFGIAEADKPARFSQCVTGQFLAYRAIQGMGRVASVETVMRIAGNDSIRREARLAQRFERQYCRECQKSHAPYLVVAMGVSLLLNHLDVPSEKDLVALEAFTNTGQSLL